jgi:hypothetical protein
MITPFGYLKIIHARISDHAPSGLYCMYQIAHMQHTPVHQNSPHGQHFDQLSAASEGETHEGKSVRKPPPFAVTAAPPPSDSPPGLQGGGKDGKPAQQLATAPADATQVHMRGPTVIHPEVETEGVNITADNVAPADRKAWKYLGQEGITYYYFCEWKGVPYFVTASSINSGEDIYHYAEAKPDGEWKLFYPDALPDFMGDLQRTVALHYDMLEWTKIIVLETAMFMLMEEVSLAGKAARIGISWWRSARAARLAGRKAAKEATEAVVEKAAQESAEAVAESAGAEAAEQVGQQAGKAFAAKKMRPFTKANARHNLQVYTGEEGVGMEAHHVFPQAEEFAEFFERAKINIHDPANMRWWPSASHKKAAKAYNNAWANFKVDFPSASQSDIFEFGKSLMTKYGF